MPTNVQVPGLGESVSEAVLIKWHKSDGDLVKTDEPLCELETDKTNVDIPSPGNGVIKRSVTEGTKVRIGQTIAMIDENGKASAKPAASAGAKPKAAPEPAKAPAAKSGSEDLAPAVRRMVEENQLDPSKIAASGPGGRITKEDVVKHMESKPAAARASDTSFAAATPVIETAAPVARGDGSGIRREPMSKIRKKIAERLVSAQHTAAILTTFNEVDLHNVMEIRAKFKDRFEKVHGVGLGFMSFFARAVVLALKEFPNINAQIDGDDIVYHDYVHLGIAVSTDRGLAVPVLRNVEKMSFAKIESEIKRLATSTREGKLALQELSGGTFTITNGGVFGSLLSTPIINPPQSGILGMHNIVKRPIAVNDQVVIRPMMYIALSYDHRLIDGVVSVKFLVRLKELLEDPARLMLEI
ncbi:MAG TPA: 2-oxoglutarate dehydrogenase complex dihydrolipoyllysine-residue succinyltransferase [Tepidisphaeraceae bacterium]|jgi:2-oxoglutarate dehydrogenase E2 component (dihydrolipoamide succinyltransferase)|nr:2-oxoglutarate dehydrogenase complex dihydrolipoyllysine-residue succinyltransferase [Tepidisphaeraceae bacterium]